jgi:MinD superfamily P-loop ATPase
MSVISIVNMKGGVAKTTLAINLVDVLELAEAALAHVAGDATERAYRRGDALEKRRKLMDAWAAFCEPKERSNVITMARLV